MTTKTQTLLTVPDLAEAVTPILGHITPAEIFAMIGEGVVHPLGYVRRAPVFSPGQILGVAQAIFEGRGEEASS